MIPKINRLFVLIKMKKKKKKKIKMADSKNPRFPAPALHYAWSLQNHGKDFFRTNMHTNVKEGLDKKLMKFEF